LFPQENCLLETNVREDIQSLSFPPIIAGGLIRTYQDVKRILVQELYLFSSEEKNSGERRNLMFC